MIKFTQFFDSKDRRLFLGIRIDVKSIKILTENVHSVVPVENTVRVEHGDHFEYKVLSEEVSPRVVRQQKFKQTVESVACWRLPGVHSGTD